MTVSSVARKVIKASGVDPDTDAGKDLPHFQALRMRIMARRATVNLQRVKMRSNAVAASTTNSSTTTTATATATATSRDDGAAAATSGESQQDDVNHNDTSSVGAKKTAASTLAKSRAMLARMKKALGRSQGGTRATLQSIENAATTA